MRMFRSRRLIDAKELTADDWHEVAVLYRAFQEAIEGIARRARMRAKQAESDQNGQDNRYHLAE